eukprot:TRINITY_DN5426_c0_g1_i1.p2 TRINITY_DN5426_c0_g1~~TRINITY_DN5426_c0_g1_i1.p2  ORF type:complete len:270 (+),score=42.05 TRINITY_DN5426_c0_g1_i1:49-858(+)
MNKIMKRVLRRNFRFQEIGGFANTMTSSYDTTKWQAEQDAMKEKLVIKDTKKWVSEEGELQVKHIAGLDISFAKEDEEIACATIVVIEYPSLNIVYEHSEMVQMMYPYVSGFLGFREIPHLLKLIEKVCQQKPEYKPDILMVDGNGIHHPRGFGCASHLGVLCGFPTIGVAKKFLQVDGLTSDIFKQQWRERPDSTNMIPIVGESGTTWGAAARTTADSTNPVFISVGHLISLESAVKVTLSTCKVRVPEAIRQADLISREFLRKQGLL